MVDTLVGARAPFQLFDASDEQVASVQKEVVSVERRADGNLGDLVKKLATSYEENTKAVTSMSSGIVAALGRIHDIVNLTAVDGSEHTHTTTAKTQLQRPPLLTPPCTYMLLVWRCGCGVLTWPPLLSCRCVGDDADHPAARGGRQGKDHWPPVEPHGSSAAGQVRQAACKQANTSSLTRHL